ncbi:glycerol-3-phosphate 1-O-acyltransferase PlsY [Clostridium sp. YIM B02551]|uniref:glycerol-3-phosphate 1-O-acyltransferase PlsY n=1 Tax=Clostridium sp. YIM B02551 TaxID=2910679 RepID=UPI001EEA62C2|nr:glycerol-3-phosphate 1-O-acyltransferase PlsY [Clostridium sp. YIM B02551]
MIIFITILIAFMLGSIPTGYLLVKHFCGIDIRTQGSGNIGSTNVKRIVGTKISIATQVGDIVKGVVAVALGIVASKLYELPVSTDIYLSIIAVVVILGHDYTPFLGFNGGKGVNTTMGAFILLAPIATLSGVVVYFILRATTKIVSIRSISLGATIPIMCIILKEPRPIIIATICASLIMIYRHKANLVRIIKKEEK